ncbi:MAG: 4Fe-4S binding protein [Promethearchaeota archaeon]
MMLNSPISILFNIFFTMGVIYALYMFIPGVNDIVIAIGVMNIIFLSLTIINSKGATFITDPEKCTSCGKCFKVCIYNGLKLKKGKSAHTKNCNFHHF